MRTPSRTGTSRKILTVRTGYARLTVRNPKPLDLVDSIKFKEWCAEIQAGLLRPGLLNVPSWPEFRDQRK